jgi:hypothetical protein
MSISDPASLRWMARVDFHKPEMGRKRRCFQFANGRLVCFDDLCAIVRG